MYYKPWLSVSLVLMLKAMVSSIMQGPVLAIMAPVTSTEESRKDV